MTLTVKVSNEVLGKVELIARRTGLSFAKVVERFLEEAMVPIDLDKMIDSPEIAKWVAEEKAKFNQADFERKSSESLPEWIRRVTDGYSIPADVDDKEEYYQAMMRKHA